MYKIQPQTLFVGKITEYLPSCHSTNGIATEIIQRGNAIEGTVIVTDNQFAGRGQRGNDWEALPGLNITLSIILKPSFVQPAHQFRLNVAVSLGIHDFLIKQQLSTHFIKWPNDVYVGTKKMGGVLIESTLVGNQMGCSIVGIGLNINQLGFINPNATSLRIAKSSKEYDLPSLIEQLCETIEKRYLQLRNGNENEQKEEYLANLFRIEEWHIFRVNEQEIEGQIIDVDETGKLVLQTRQAIKTFGFKEIAYVI